MIAPVMTEIFLPSIALETEEDDAKEAAAEAALPEAAEEAAPLPPQAQRLSTRAAEAIRLRIRFMKKGLEFISDPDNEISEDNIHTLYDIAIGQYLPENDKLKPGVFYRHDSVYIIGQELEHIGLPYEKLSEYMSKFVAFINAESTMNDLLKAAVIHFYIAYLHPYFDGNGRMPVRRGRRY